MTLLGGLASTIFAPLTAALAEHLGWRHTYLVWPSSSPWSQSRRTCSGCVGAGRTRTRPSTAHAVHDRAGAIARSRPFVLLVAAIGLGTFTAFAVVVNQVPLLIERGLSTSAAAWALGLGGLGQVLGRLGYGRLTARAERAARGVVILGLSAAATVLLAVLPGPRRAADRRAMLAGAARGCSPCCRPPPSATAGARRTTAGSTDSVRTGDGRDRPRPVGRRRPRRDLRRLPGRVRLLAGPAAVGAGLACSGSTPGRVRGELD